MKIRIYKSLPEDAAAIRTEVFIKEQGFVEEFDEKDARSIHLVSYDGNRAVGTARVFALDKEFLIGRIAVVKDYRGQGIGAFLIKEAEKIILDEGGCRALIHAQTRAKEFYLKQGYIDTGKSDEEEGCPHIWLYKNCGQN